MFGRGLNLFKLFGFQVRVDASWLLLALLITWSLASALFPSLYPDLSTRTYWVMGVLGAVGVFFSIVIHELSHSLVARRYGLRIKGITLFVFGGVADMEEEPERPAAEFWMAIAGPIASIVIAVAASLVALGGRTIGWPVWLNGTFGWLGSINLILAAFNLVPAFPLDGGRVLRSALWHWKQNLKWATRITSSLGSGFGLFLIVMGVLNFINANFVGGMWLFLIGLFLRNASQMSYRQLMVRRALEGEPIRRFMQRDVHTVPAETTLSDFVENYVYRHHHKLFPVVDNGDLRGCVTTHQLKEVPREEWDARTVGEILEPCSEANSAPPDKDAMKTLINMNRNGKSRLLVIDDGRLQGILSLKDLMKFISLKLEIEEDVEGETAAMTVANAKG